MYGSFFEYSDLKQNQKNQITESFFGFSDLVLKRKKGKRNKQINGISFVCVLFVGFLNPKQKNKNRYICRLHQKAERSERRKKSLPPKPAIDCPIIFSLSYGRI